MAATNSNVQTILLSHVALGDKQCYMRTTDATQLLKTIKREYKGKGIRNWVERAMQDFLAKHRATFGDGGLVVLLKMDTGDQQARNVDWNVTYCYPHDNGGATFFRALDGLGEIEKFLKKYSPPTLEDSLQKYRGDLDKLFDEKPEARDLLEDFDEILQFFERQFDKSEQGNESAKRILNSLAPINKLDKQWAALMDDLQQRPALGNSGLMANSNEPQAVEAPLVPRDMEIVFGDTSSMMEAFADYAQVYNSDEFQNHFRKLMKLVDQGFKGKQSLEWYFDWAKCVAFDDYARDLNDSRRFCLKLLYRMYDECHDNPLAMQHLQRNFKKQWVWNILQVCLPMDRANALCHMQVHIGPANQRGIHWISKPQAAHPVLREFLTDYEGFPSMNKRYQWIIGTFGLSSNFLQRWLKPVFHRMWIDDGKLQDLLHLCQQGSVELYVPQDDDPADEPMDFSKL